MAQKNEKRGKNMRKHYRKRFLGTIKTVDGINIILKYKSGRIFHKKHFCIRKKCYSINIYAVFDSQKRFIYSLTGFCNTIPNS